MSSTEIVSPAVDQARHGVSRKLPLVVDLDGTLLNTDCLVEAIFAYLRANPLRVFLVVYWLLRGKAWLKARLAERMPLDVTTLPYNRALLDAIRSERTAGRPVWMATATHQSQADAIADHLGLFCGALGTSEANNLSRERKRDALVERFGVGGFDYAGNARDDLPIWAAANQAWVVNPEWGVARRASRVAEVAEVIRDQPPRLRSILRAMRLHQWAKNALIFVPLATSHQVLDGQLLLAAGVAFLAFGLCASGVYLLNDLVDLRDDRQHPVKRLRPLASGALPVKWGALLAPGLVFAGLLAGLLLSPLFLLVLVGYLALTSLYSFYLKRLVLVDVITLAMLYTARIIAGAVACGLTLTFWILAFSVFIFLSLALVKRYTELAESDIREKETLSGRGYRAGDLQLLTALGAASGYLSVLVLALYIQDPGTAELYSRPALIWLACPILLYWVSRTWLLTHRGQMNDDPVVFALKDRASQLAGALFVTVFVLAI